MEPLTEDRTSPRFVALCAGGVGCLVATKAIAFTAVEFPGRFGIVIRGLP